MPTEVLSYYLKNKDQEGEAWISGYITVCAFSERA